MNVNKMNPLAGLIANYGDSDDEAEEDSSGTSPNNSKNNGGAVAAVQNYAGASAAIHPSPIPHCPWSACYDETSGFTYYWNQKTNAVTWEAPPEYLLALKVAQQQLTASGSGQVTAEEWQLYQQALAEKQNTQAKTTSKVVPKPPKKNESTTVNSKGKNNKNTKKRPLSDDDEEKIELITSYHNSDSDSNDEADTPVKTEQPPVVKAEPKSTPQRKRKNKIQEYGPALPPNLNYAVPIGPELPPELSNNAVSDPVTKTQNAESEALTSKTNDDENQDESTLLLKLKDKAKLLEKLGGEIPKELQQMIQEETGSGNATPKTEEPSSSQASIDDLLEEIEKKELPKIAHAKKVDSENVKSNNVSAKNSPTRDGTPPMEPKPLFPSFQNIEDSPAPIVAGNEEKKVDVTDKKGANLYLASSSERIEHVNKKKLRISNSVLPKKEPVYTTKYAQVVEGFSSERVGLGFSKDEENTESPKNAINYGNGLMFTKGETLNQDTPKEDDLNEITKLIEKKLIFFNRQQPCAVTPLQEMMVQLRSLVMAFEAGALAPPYLRRWAEGARRTLREHERGAAPPGWGCCFLRSEGRYCYRRESDGFVQYEYPATTHTDMDICTTPPHPGIEAKDEIQPALPPSPTPAATPSPPSFSSGAWRARTPPPPSWADPPPPGCDDLPPPLPLSQEPRQDIGDALASFYSDIAQLDKVEKTPSVPETLPVPETPSSSPETVQQKERHKESYRPKERVKESKVSKKKTKVKISASVGLKHKSVSNMVAKWQQVAEEINSD